MSEAAAARWTPEQEQAITAGGTHILVAAAAGAGKTATLVERVIRRLTDPVAPLDVDRLLVVTFTEAAAAEMRQRLAAALHKGLAQDPENTVLQRQLALLGRAAISTLHSFCLGLVRQYFYRLGLDPALSVMNEHEALLLRREVLDDLLTERFDEEADGPFYALLEHFADGGDGEGLKELILTVYDYVQSLPWPKQWLDAAVARFEVPPDTPISALPWWEPLRRHCTLELTRAATALAEAGRLCRRPGGPAAYGDVLARDLERVEAARQASGDWDELAAAVTAATGFDRLPPLRKGNADEALQEQAKALRDQARKAVKALQETYFDRPAAAWVADLPAMAPHLRTLADLVLQFDAAFRTAKVQQGAVDFNDLERYCLQVLLDPEAPAGELLPSDVARELRGRYAEILVDEYQDINAVQDAILTLVARDGQDGPANRFMVGDVKQSIYRFRHADPSLFLAKYQTYRNWQPAGDEANAATGARIVLGANFRSRAGVVDAVNFVFRQILTAGVGELDYDAAAELVCRAAYPPEPGAPAAADTPAGPPVEVHLLDRDFDFTAAPAPDDEDEAAAEATAAGAAAAELAELSALEREARLVAQRIRTLVDGTDTQPPLLVWDREAGEYRPVRYRDMVILLRATSGRANLFLEALGRAGVPAYAQLSTGYFAATEVEVILSLLQIMDNPGQDIPLAAVLRSPIVGLSSADLARIRLAAPGGSFYEAVIAAGRGQDRPDLAAVLSRFLQALEQWRTAARRKPLSEVLWQIYGETGYLRYVGGMPGGAQRHANLIALYDRARQFDQFARQGLFRFLRFIERLQEGEADLGTAPALGEGEDVVRILSIHRSKGLEFPVVFVADLGKSFGRQDQQGDLLLQRRLGLGPRRLDPEQRAKWPTLAFHAVRQAIRLEALAEEMRILYVALTRARERLILVGSCRDLEARCRSWGAAAAHRGWPLPEATLAAAESYLDWLGPALARHAAAAPLQAAAGVGEPADPQVAADPSRWELYLWDAAAQLGLPAAEAAATAEEQPDWERIGALAPLDRPIASDVPDQLARIFAWRYPFAPVVHRFAKLSVTELKGHFDPNAEQPLPNSAKPQTVGQIDRRPRFLQTTRRTLTPAEFGTLMHLVLQHLDLARPLDPAGVANQVGELVQRELLLPGQAEAVDTAAIAAFFASPLGQRICARPEQVRREVSFTLGLPAAEVYPDLPPEVAAGETIVVQGMIDLLLEEADAFLLVDYKTDRREPEQAATAYREQVTLYRRAVQEILGKPVREAYLHFLTSNQSVAVPASVADS